MYKEQENQGESIDDRLDREYEAERDREASVPAVWEDEEGKVAEPTPLYPHRPGGLDSILPTKSCK